METAIKPGTKKATADLHESRVRDVGQSHNGGAAASTDSPLVDGGRTLSSSNLSQELQIPLNNTSYHVNELAKADLIVLVGTRPVRGATEHSYRLHH